MSDFLETTSGGDDHGELGFQLAGVGLCVSRERVIERCNPSFGEMFGYLPAELAGQSLLCLYPTRDEFERTGIRLLPVLQTTGRYSDERIMRRKDGSLFWCHVSGRAQRREQPFACAVWTFDDLSVQRPVARRLTGREREVAQLLVVGKQSKEIAKILDLSPRTVDSHRARLLEKYAVRSHVELVSKLLGGGLPGA